MKNPAIDPGTGMPSSTARSDAPSPPRLPNVRSAATLLFVTAVILVIFSEIVSRFMVGLGDPPLYQADATMEYMLQPSKTYYRFHNRVSVNRYGMRADEFPPHKSSSEELRVLVFGDSIVYGGVRIDQNEIGTEILKPSLQREFGRPVVIGNASATSWGPPNELAYLQRYGTLDADVVILVLSSHDYADAPTFTPVVGIAAQYPGKKPVLAVADLLESYFLPRYLHIGETPAGIDKSVFDTPQPEKDISECRDAEREFFRLARSRKAKIALVQHLSSMELAGKYQTGYYANQAVAQEQNVPYVDDADELRAALNSGANVLVKGDTLHLNRAGQPILAHALQRGVEMALKRN